MAVVTYQLYNPPGGDYTIAYRFKKGKLHGSYEVEVDGAGFIGYVVKCIDGWSDSFVLNPLRETRREAAEDLINAWIVRKVGKAIAKIREET